MIHAGVELPSVMSIERAAEHFGVSVDAVRRWIEQGAVATVRLNGLMRIRTESIADRRGVRALSRTNADDESSEIMRGTGC